MNGKKLLNLLKYLKNFTNIKMEFKKRDKLMPERGTLSTSKAEELLNYKSEWPLEKAIIIIFLVIKIF